MPRLNCDGFFFVCFVVHDAQNVRLHNFINLFCVERSGHTTSVTLTTHTPSHSPCVQRASLFCFGLLLSKMTEADCCKFLLIPFILKRSLSSISCSACYIQTSLVQCAAPKLQVNMLQVLTPGGSTNPRNDCSGSNETERSAIKLTRR